MQRSLIVLALAAATTLLVPRAAAATEAAAAPTATGSASPAARRAARPAAPVLVDINSANRATLKTLPGIGDAAAGRIIAGRPYLSKADLVTENILQPGVYAALRSAVVARQKAARPIGTKSAKGPT